MPWVPKFHLVDAAGNPLEERFQRVARKLEWHFFNAFPEIGDEAVVCNCVEQTAIKVHAHEQRYGRVQDLASYFMRAYSNVVSTMLRSKYHTKHEFVWPDKELERRAGPSRIGSAEAVERQILIDQTLRGLDENKRMMLLLDGLGYSAKDIARRCRTNEGNVYTTIHRAREEARKLLEKRGLADPDKP